MGEISKLTLEGLMHWKSLIDLFYNEYKVTKNLGALMITLTWIYEMLWNFSVMGTDKTMNVIEVKRRWGYDFGVKLFRLRKRSVHNPYESVDILDDNLKFYNAYEDYIELLLESPENDLDSLLLRFNLEVENEAELLEAIRIAELDLQSATSKSDKELKKKVVDKAWQNFVDTKERLALAALNESCKSKSTQSMDLF